MVTPYYKNDCIVNLTSSILDAFGEKGPYPSLNELRDLNTATAIILVVIDGLGYHYVENYGTHSSIRDNVIKKLSSVFPSTTASALTSLETGVAPQQHGITGWFMFLKELGVLTTILPFRPRYGTYSFPHDNIQRSDIFIEQKVYTKIETDSFVIYPSKIIDGKVNEKRKNILVYNTLNGMFRQIKKAVFTNNNKKYVYAYWSEFDTFCHHEGLTSSNTLNHFRELDVKIASLVASLKGTNSTLLITGDHGLIDTPASNIVYLDDHPHLRKTLTLPLCGEPRVAYCYVHPSKAPLFEDYIKNELYEYCDLYKSEELLEKGFFGLYTPHENLTDRIGDYILMMKKNYIIKDKILKEKPHILLANHGGITEEEMLVPLIVYKNI